MKNQKYIDWIKTLPCCICHTDQNVDPHHLVGSKDRGVGFRETDIWVAPLCRQHHSDLHQDPVAFELAHGVSQWEMVARTVKLALFQGIISWR